MSPVKTFSYYEKWLGHIFIVVLSISASTAMCADDVPDAPGTIGSLPSIPLSLEESSASQPSEKSSDLAWNSEIAFDWKAWAVVGVAGIVLVSILRVFCFNSKFDTGVEFPIQHSVTIINVNQYEIKQRQFEKNLKSAKKTA